MPDDVKPKVHGHTCRIPIDQLGVQAFIACNSSDEGTVRYEWYGCVTFRYILRQLGWMKVEAWKLQVGFLL